MNLKKILSKDEYEQLKYYAKYQGASVQQVLKAWIEETTQYFPKPDNTTNADIIKLVRRLGLNHYEFEVPNIMEGNFKRLVLEHLKQMGGVQLVSESKIKDDWLKIRVIIPTQDRLELFLIDIGKINQNHENT